MLPSVTVTLRVNRSNRSAPVGVSFGFSLPVTGQNQAAKAQHVFQRWLRRSNNHPTNDGKPIKPTVPSEPHLEEEPQEPLWLDFWLDWCLVRNWPRAADFCWILVAQAAPTGICIFLGLAPWKGLQSLLNVILRNVKCWRHLMRNHPAAISAQVTSNNHETQNLQ